MCCKSASYQQFFGIPNILLFFFNLTEVTEDKLDEEYRKARKCLFLFGNQAGKERTAGSLPRVQPLAHPGCWEQSRHNAPGFFLGPQPCLSNTLHCHHSPTGTHLSALTWARFLKHPRRQSPKHITSRNLSQNTYKEINLQ